MRGYVNRNTKLLFLGGLFLLLVFTGISMRIVEAQKKSRKMWYDIVAVAHAGGHIDGRILTNLRM